MAGKTTTRPKLKKEKPEVDMEAIKNELNLDDIIFRLKTGEYEIDRLSKLVDKLSIHELTMRVEKVEARLGLG